MTKARTAPLWLPAESDVPATGLSIAWGPWIVLLLMTCAFAVGFSWLDLRRHDAFQTHAFDLGNVDQAVWNTLHGHPFRFTSMVAGNGVITTRLAIHVEPILLLISLLYLVHGGPQTLLVLQATVVALGAVPAYLLARRALGRQWLSLVFPLAYLMHPSLQHAVVYEFHAVTLSACLLLWALYFAYRQSAPGFAVFGVLAAATKEEIGFLVAMLGLVFVLHRRWHVGFMAIVCGLGWSLMSFLLIIPHFNAAGHSPYLGRYAYLGIGGRGGIHDLLRRPDVLAHTLTSASRIDYLDRLLHPLGYLPLLGIPVLLLALPSLLINMLSAKPEMYSGFYQYSAPIVPFIIAAAALGTATALRYAETHRAWGRRSLPGILALLLVVSVFLEARRYGSAPLAAVQRVPVVASHQRLEARLLTAVPPGVSVAASDDVEPHLADRYWTYVLPMIHPRNGPAARYLVLDASVPSWPTRPRKLHDVVAGALRGNYGIERARDGVLVLRRGARRKRLPAAFYSFLFAGGAGATRSRARWGPLHLLGFTIPHPGAAVDPMMTSIDVNTYWQLSRRTRRNVTVAVYYSPVYTGSRPHFSGLWRGERGSPAWDWVPLDSWVPHRTVHAAVVPLRPDVRRHGKVDLVVGVRGLGQVTGVPARLRVPGYPMLLRLGTVQVSP